MDIRIAWGACLGRRVHPEQNQHRVWTCWGGGTVMTTARMLVITPGSGAGEWSKLWRRLTAPCWTCEQCVLAPDGAELDSIAICAAAAPRDT